MKVTDLTEKLVRRAHEKGEPPPFPVVPYEHRCGIGIHHSRGPGDPHALARWKVERQGLPGHSYTFHRHGPKTYQCATLEEVTQHAMTHSPLRWGIVYTGDYDRAEPHPGDLNGVAELCALLMRWQGWSSPSELVGPARLLAPRVAGHRELRWGSKDRDANGHVLKSCPGEKFDMDAFRLLVSVKLAGMKGYTSHDAELALRTAGVVI